ncbi:MAG: zinc-binding dehydrogenase [Candidatus Latescibacteria bacterium]|nr:zinc-binding dehydrogenase [Candidatus Latescibacterota bacterium]
MTGKAAVINGFNQPMEFRDYLIPDVGPDDLLVKISMANICGSDLHFLRGGGPKTTLAFPQIMGHEMVGSVYALGDRVTTDSAGDPLRVGDRVVFSYFRPCGTCWACLTHVPGCLNRYRDWLGVSSETPPHFNGAYGEYYYMKPGHWVFTVPDELPDQLVSPTNCALSEVIYGLHRLGITLGDTIVIQGVGGLGLYATAIAREMGAGRVIVIDRIPERLELAGAFGADHLLNAAEADADERIARVREWTAGRGPDVMAEFTGVPQVLQEGLLMLRVGGRYLWIGNVNLGTVAEIDPGRAVRESKTIIGLVVYEPWVMPRALDFLKRTQHKYPFHRIISHVFPFERINEAFEFARQGKAIRVGIEMR